ncbi:4-carboxymuconolactone decarboxylase [Sporosarcina sp. P37]|uniref:carboxymuconolactone decarboxylase family protein n=1 Tax=unclassified Sporosarcina TaxID=2647733 RepID=UPI0009BDC8C6|nr:MULTISPECIES: carboxymuconolactone decarboxylase family protein [unclassified Sporosarcina]ARD47213.1 4-carboxymuconolactone decarboxylase [Sporosarcina sp. P33]ARK23781.1 4-carboxymuconolactone decarboxylase [Sporosarcina sp. P37]PID18928.1 carboxymuconolactone decarboxylase family protein [Sporosarcina sp. P35]
MSAERLEAGLKKIREYVSEEEAERMMTADALKELAPDLRKYIVEFAYGEIYSRPGLDSKQRQLVTLSSLVTQGATAQIRTHVSRALTVGLTKTEIIESMMQLIPYAGFPRVQNALTVVKELLSEEN